MGRFAEVTLGARRTHQRL
ncbi:hypothetical protein [Hydrogenophaga sp.]